MRFSLFFLIVNAHSGQKINPPSNRFIQKVLKTGADIIYGIPRAKLLDLEPGAKAKAIEIVNDETSDGLDHTCELVLASSAHTPGRVVFRAGKSGLGKKI